MDLVERRMALVLTALFAAAVIAGPTKAGDTARLCIEGQCSAAGSLETARVAPADHRRSAVWLSADGTRVVLAEIATNATTLTPGESVTQIRVLSAGEPRKVHFVLSDGTSTWSWDLSNVKRFTLSRPARARSLVVEAEEFRRVAREVTQPAITIVLQPLPVISGQVTDGNSSRALVAARIILPSGEVLATSGADGRFRVPIRGDWPTSLHIEAAGHAERIVEVPRAPADTDLDVIQM